MPMIDRMTGAADDRDIPVARPLLRALQAAGIQRPLDNGTLSPQQMSVLLENKTPAQRIELKTALLNAKLYPRALRVASPVKWHDL